MKAEIVSRVEPCRCGCQGRDPWHARTFTRELHDVTEVEPIEVKVRAYREPLLARRVAWAHFPWGDEEVAEVFIEAAGRRSVLGWFIRA